MKEEDIKKILKKSTIETSDSFVDTLMSTLEPVEAKQVKQPSIRWSFAPVILVCTLLVLGSTFIVFKQLGTEDTVFSLLQGVPKIPVMSILTLVLLYGLNSVVTLRETLKSAV